jgi:hypothetical protein
MYDVEVMVRDVWCAGRGEERDCGGDSEGLMMWR